MNDFESADLVEQTVICQKGKVMLEAECGDPEIVTERFAFFERLRNGSSLGQIVSDANVKRDRIEISSDYRATPRQRLDLCFVFCGLSGT